MKKNTVSKILIVGLFVSEKNRLKVMRTAADQLAELLETNGIGTITTSAKLNKIGRFVDTVATIVFRRKQYHIGIVPLYGGLMSYIWESVASLLLKALGKKVVLIIHGGSIPDRMKKSPGKYLRSYRRADVVVCPSGFMLNMLQQYGIQGVLIENVVQLSDYTFHPKQTFAPRLFWMRTLEDVYNPEMAVRVGGLLAKKYPGFRMVMAGYDRGLLATLKQMAAQLNIAGKIEFPGYISRKQKEAYAQTHDIYVCTNRIDNAPVSFIEMMTMGLPVVSVNIGGIPFMVTNGQNGLLVQLDDDKAMAHAIESLVEDAALARQLVSNGVAYAQQFGEAPVLKKWKQLFERLGDN